MMESTASLPLHGSSGLGASTSSPSQKLVACLNHIQSLRADLELSLGPSSGISLRRYASATATLADLLLDAAGQVRTLLQRVIEACDFYGEAKPEAQELANNLGDLCFAARLDLRQVASQLDERRIASSRSELLVLCERVHRRIQRALGGAAGGLARITRIPDQLSPEGREEETRTAVAVRGFYRDYWLMMESLEGSSATTAAKLCRVAQELSELLASPIADLIRLSDNLTLSTLQQRVEMLTSGGPPSENPAELLADVCAATSMLRHVNQRELLKLHDVDILQEVRHLILSQSAHTGLLELLAEKLRPVLGRDKELDRLTEARVAVDEEVDWLTKVLIRLEQVLQELLPQ